jgi:peptide-methionine (R)-S-oxide reductase
MNARDQSSDESGTPSSQAADDLPKTEAEWRKRLTPEQFRVMREHGTERPGSSKFITFDKQGTYKCAGCGQVLFESETKFDHGCGWPSFTRPAGDGAIGTQDDYSYLMHRIEVHCNKCGAHLGHVFDDGPGPTRLRYCMNGVALDFEPAKNDGDKP